MNHQDKQPIPLACVLRRAWWALLILVHVPALLGVARSVVDAPGSVDLSATFVLAATIAVFFLKLLDAPFLRFRSGRGSTIAFLLAFSLVHHEIAATQAGRDILQQTPAALVAGVVIEGIRRGAPALRRFRDRLAAALCPPRVFVCLGAVALPGHVRSTAACIAATARPRAPPV